MNNRDTIRQHLKMLFEPGDVFEIRAPNTIQRKGYDARGTASGYFTFDTISTAVDAIVELDDAAAAPGVYVTLNPVDPSLLARAMNRLKLKAKGTTKDHNIVRRRWLVIDIDPIRASDISASDAELSAAQERAEDVLESLGNADWPEPAIALSGNGVHLIYRVDLPTDDGELLKRVLASIADHFNDDACKVDQTMYNPARISKIIGTMARKGDDVQGITGVEDRPHRRAQFVNIPDELKVVPLECLEHVADAIPRRTFDASVTTAELDGTVPGTQAWLEAHNVPVKGVRSTATGTMILLDVCPITGTVSNGASDIAVGVETGGKLSFHNRHDRGEGLTWDDLREALDPMPQMMPGVDLSGLLDDSPETDADSEALPPGWRPFPTDALPEPVATYVRAVAQAQMLDEATVAVPLLAALAGSVNSAMTVQVKRGWREPCIVWSCVVMRSGDGKSHALDAALNFLRDFQIEELARYERESRAFETACLEKPEEPPDEPRPAARCVANDATIEGLAKLLATNHRGILLERDELAGWLGSFDRYARSAGGDRPFWLSAHGGRSHLIDRKTSNPIVIPACAVSLVGTIQPGVLDRMVSEQDRESGLVARLLIAHPPAPAQEWTEDEVDQSLIDQMNDVFRWLLSLQRDPSQGDSSKPYTVPLSAEAKAVWVKWYNTAKRRQRESPTDDHAANWSKQIGYGARLALLFELIMRAAEIAKGVSPLEEAIAATCGRIRLEAVERSLEVIEWFVREGERILAHNDASESTKSLIKLQEWIERRGGRATVRDVYHGIHRYRGKKDEAEAALDALVEAGMGRWEHRWVKGQRGKGTKLIVLTQQGE